MTVAQPAAALPREADSASASAVKAMLAEGRHADARERYSDIVGRHQRRASRIAFHYLRDAAEADEAVQDAFVKAYTHLSSFREELPFEVWFTRILINGCLDRIKARTRRQRWLVPAPEPLPGQPDFTDRVASIGPSPEDQVLARERRQKLAGALARLPERQRSVFLLSHYEGCTSREVSALTGLNESTVRVHLFRAIRRLRTLLADAAHGGRQSVEPVTRGKRRVHP
jgi:RNA polymerase sigma-70 factor (ECF subfamily)